MTEGNDQFYCFIEKCSYEKVSWFEIKITEFINIVVSLYIKIESES